MLKQSSTFRPLMRQLCILAIIAMRARQHHIVDIMTRIRFLAAQRNRVFKVIDIRSILALLKFLEAVVARKMLSLQLVLNLLSSENAFNRLLKRPSLLIVRSISWLMLFSVQSIMLPLSLIALFTMLITIGFCPAGYFFFVALIVQSVLFSVTCFSRLGVEVLRLTFSALPAQIRSRMPLKKLSSCKKHLLTFVTSFIPVRYSLPATCFSLPNAYFAGIIQTIGILGFATEKFRGSGFPFKASVTLLQRNVLRYSVHTSELPFIRHALGCLQHRESNTLLPLNYITNPLVRPLHAHFSYRKAVL